jgi:lysophospholipase L1-like esterase
MADALTTGEFVAILYDLLVSAGLTPPEGWEEDLEAAVEGWTDTDGAEGFNVPGLNLKVASTLSNVAAVPQQMRAWWLGTATGGYTAAGVPVPPGGSPDGGYYPLRDGTGKTTYLPSPAKVISGTQKGDKGDQGNPGWVPVLSIVNDGNRRVQRVTDWTGSTGTKPATGKYLGPAGYVDTAAEATDIRGPLGPALYQIATLTKAALDANLAFSEGSFGMVYNDATAANNGTYIKAGAVGAGSWVKTDNASGITFSTLPVESGYAAAFVDATGKAVWLIDLEGQFIAPKFTLPDGNVSAAKLTADLLARIPVTGIASLFSMMGDESGLVFVMQDLIGKLLMQIQDTGEVNIPGLVLPLGSITAAQLDAAFLANLQAGKLPAAIASMFSTISDESGWAFAATDVTGKILFGISNVDGSLTGTISEALHALFADVAGNVSVVVNPLAAAGDSITAGAGSSGTGEGQGPWPKQFTDLTGVPSVNLGIGGQDSSRIIARAGGAPSLLTVTGNVIPASGAVAVTARSVSLLTNQGTQSLAGVLAGVKGTLTRAVDDSYTFTRTTAGEARNCPAATPFVPDLAVNNQSSTWAIFSGRNDGTANLAGSTKTLVAAQWAWIPHDRKFVIGVTTKSDGSENAGSTAYNQIVAYNNDQAAKYGSQFIDIRRYLIDFGLADAGITPTSDDLAAIANDVIPPSLLSPDLLHWNNAGYKILAQRVAALRSSKGWN